MVAQEIEPASKVVDMYLASSDMSSQKVYAIHNPI